MYTNEKAKQTFLQHLPVPVWLVVKSFEVAKILVLYVKNTYMCRFPINLSFKPVMTSKFHAYLEKRTNKFRVSIYSVYVLVSEVKLSQTFIQLCYLDKYSKEDKK